MANSMDAITYDNLGEKLVEALPELRSAYEAELREWVSDKPGPHVIYGDVLNPHLLALLESGGSEETLCRIFAFLERLANHEDVHVQEVVAVTVVARLLGNKALLNRARQCMGAATLRISHEMEDWAPTLMPR